MLQTLIVILIVLIAAAWLGRMAWRTLRPAKDAAGGSCGTGCGCAPAATPARKQRPAAR